MKRTPKMSIPLPTLRTVEKMRSLQNETDLEDMMQTYMDREAAMQKENTEAAAAIAKHMSK